MEDISREMEAPAEILVLQNEEAGHLTSKDAYPTWVYPFELSLGFFFGQFVEAFANGNVIKLLAVTFG